MRRFFLLVACTLLSGFLFAAAMPPADFQILGWLCLVPMLAALRESRLVFSILAPLGLAYFAAYVTTTGILYHGPKLEGEDAWHYAGFLLYGMALSPALLIARGVKTFSFAALAWLAALFVCAESLLLLYLPAHLALTQYRSPVMLSLAPWVGIWGVSYVLWFVQITVAYRWNDILMEIKGRGSKAVIGALAAVCMGFVGLWQYSPSTTDRAKPPAPGMLRLAAVQTNLPDFDELSRWNEEAKAAHAELVVWPELSAAGIAAGGRTEKLVELSSKAAQPAFVTTFPDDSQPKPFNSAAVFAGGKESDRYHKRKPFGCEAKDHQAGTSAVVVAANGRQVGLNVCFDSCFPSVMRDTAMKGDASYIALPCMGPESPYGVIQAVHGAFTPFRSAELGVPIVRGESSAFALITDRNGRIVAEAPPGFEGVILGDVQDQPKWTLIKTVGYWFLVVCWAAVPLPLILLFKKKRSTREL